MTNLCLLVPNILNWQLNNNTVIYNWKLILNSKPYCSAIKPANVSILMSIYGTPVAQKIYLSYVDELLRVNSHLHQILVNSLTKSKLAKHSEYGYLHKDMAQSGRCFSKNIEKTLDLEYIRLKHLTLRPILCHIKISLCIGFYVCVQ